MRTHVALVRGINVAGRNKVAMADLRVVAAGLGHAEVATHVNSGNLVFAASAPEAADGAIADGLAAGIEGGLGVAAAVVVVGTAEWAHIVAAQPFGPAPPATLHAVVLPAPADADRLAAVGEACARAAAKGSGDRAVVEGRVVYLSTPGGLGRSVLAEELGRGGAARSVMRAGTARNWATVLAVAALLGV